MSARPVTPHPIRIRLDSDRPEVVDAVRRTFSAAGVERVDIDTEYAKSRLPGWSELLVDASQDPLPDIRVQDAGEGRLAALAAFESELTRAVAPHGFTSVLLDVGPSAYANPPAPVRVRINLTAGPNEIRAIDKLFRAHGLEVQVEPTFYNPHEAEVRTVTVVGTPVELPPALRRELQELRGGDITYVDRLPS